MSSTIFTTFNFSDAISILALGISFLALGWNIIRDFITDRVKLDVHATVGGVIPYADKSGKAFFRDADSTFIPTNPLVAIIITNIGRRTMVISKIHGQYKKTVDGKKKWIFVATQLPKTLHPYETITEIMNDPIFIKAIQKDTVKNIYVQDTKGRSWALSRKALKRLKKTAFLLIK